MKQYTADSSKQFFWMERLRKESAEQIAIPVRVLRYRAAEENRHVGEGLVRFDHAGHFFPGAPVFTLVHVGHDERWPQFLGKADRLT